MADNKDKEKKHTVVKIIFVFAVTAMIIYGYAFIRALLG